VWLSQVPHYALGLAIAVTIYGPRALPLVTTSYPTWVPYLTDTIAFATAILALAKQFNPGTPQAVASDQAIAAKGTT
jgi:hypothetical protein